MPKFRRKANAPDVEAIQWRGDNESEVSEFCGKYGSHQGYDVFIVMYPKPTLWAAANGMHLPVEAGDWIIRDSYGYYPCKPDIFEQTYEDADAPANSIPMILHCPACGKQHIDKPEPDICECGWHRTAHRSFDQRVLATDGSVFCTGFKVAWTNPPHNSHLCRTEDGGCGTIWRPADVPTNGVKDIETHGSADTWRVHVQSDG